MNCLSIIGAAALGLSLSGTTISSDKTPPITTEPNYTVTGVIKGLDDGWVYLQHISTSTIDSVKASGGKFLFSGTVSGDPEHCRLGIRGRAGREFRAEFFVEKG